MRGVTPRATPNLSKYVEHLAYEVQMLTSQARHHGSIPDPVEDPDPREAERYTYLEAALIHLRLLDAFLRGSDHINARHWIPAWTSAGCLSARQRQWVNESVAHFGKGRVAQREWDLAGLTNTCVNEVKRFIGALDPETRPAFDGCQWSVDAWLSRPAGAAVLFATTAPLVMQGPFSLGGGWRPEQGPGVTPKSEE